MIGNDTTKTINKTKKEQATRVPIIPTTYQQQTIDELIKDIDFAEYERKVLMKQIKAEELFEQAQKSNKKKSNFNDKPISNVVIYARSLTSEGFSIERQVHTNNEFAVNHGYNVLQIFIDKGKSARTLERPALQEMIRYCQNSENKVDAIIVWKLDRLNRNFADYQDILMNLLEKCRITLLSATEPNDDTPEVQLMRNIQMSLQ